MTLLHRNPSLAALFALLCATPMTAQSLTTGALGGTLHDERGDALADVRVVLRSAGTAELRTAETDALGEFRIDDLAPGTYNVTCTRAGFADLRLASVEVQAAQAVRLTLALQLATATQTITVRAGAAERPSLQDSPLNAALAPAELRALPIDGRRFQDFALLTPLTNLANDPRTAADDPGIAATDSSTADADSSSSADTAPVTTRALSPSQSSFTEDGATGTRAYDGAPRGGTDAPFNVPLEAIREFQVRAVGEGSPLGRDAAGSVNAVTRRAEDRLHGSAFFLLRNSTADAADPFAIATHYNAGEPYSEYVKPRDQRQQFGGALGRLVPHTHGRLFLFAAAEAQRRSFPGISTPDNPAFFTLTVTQRALLGNRGVISAAIARGLSFLDGLGGPVARHSKTVAITPRLDFNTGARGHLLVTYTGLRHDAPSALRDGATIPRSRDNFSTLQTTADTLQLRQSLGLSPRWLVQFGGAASSDERTITAAASLDAEPHSGPLGTVPQVTIDLGNAATGGQFRFGTPTASSRRVLPQERRLELQASASYSGRAHSLALELAGSFLDTRADTFAATAGAYQYASRSTGGRAGGLVDFLTDYTYGANSYPNGGCPSIYAAVHLFCFQSFTQGFGADTSTRFHTGEAAAALQDIWRLTPRLHVTVGARYEYFRMPLPQHPNLPLDTVFGNLGQTTFLPGDPGNLAPRLGIAYGVSDKTVVRLGYGIHFGRVTGRVLQQVLANTAQVTSNYNLRTTPTVSIDPACSSVGVNFGFPATYTCGYGGAATRTTGATLLSRRFQLPTIQDAELTVERQIGHGFTVSVSYAAALSRELPNSVDANIAPSLSTVRYSIQRTDNSNSPGVRNGSTFAVPLYTQRISPNYGPVTVVLSNGNGVYQAGVVQLTRHLGNGFTVRGAYTFSKSLDTERVTGSAADQDAQFDPFDARYDRALSNLDRRHKISALAVWSPRIEHGSHLLRSAANGFSLSPIVLVTSGRPYSFLVQGGTSLPGGRESLNGSGGATYLPSVGRNTLRLPPIASADLRLSRVVPLGSHAARDGATLRLIAEAFNLSNHRNVTSVTQRAFLPGTAANGITPLVFQDAATIAAEGLTTQPFATPTSSGTDVTRARRVQVGLRFDW